ncbi:group II intron reverse transcriptase/maturase [Streptomyces sp. NL15-2K]|uniref:group II intron reverse transcriptase/maturase n=1 Tax=Streptomyces sp. NL15-2K TaxID=376149 RepID=UPI000F586740|nr:MULTISPECIES: group II intron reverse transcriptase/maturase [Actinomycetes]WKX08770.1 group II intron reverse transcriptase/maturase [Kutzneria buriramensis]
MSGPADKPFAISKRLVWEAYERVKANKGAAGVDECSIEDFEKDLRGNLYKIWNRMSSGTYFPPPVKAVEIPKPGGTRILGVPTVADRIAQTVVALTLEPRTESIFHDDSYGYRPRRSALQAVERCRQRCWKKDWVLDLDVQKFFDSVDHALMVKAVEANTDQRWVVLYVKRWLVAPLQLSDGTLQERDRGTPQGSAVSPVLANLFMHYAFDQFLAREFPSVDLERYADDAVVHCVTERQARQVWAALEARMEEVGLRLHPDKTKLVYCKDSRRRGSAEHTSFKFLGYTFAPRKARYPDGKAFTSFLPAVSPEALKAMGQQVREWRIHRRTRLELIELADWINPVVSGWMTYYGRFYRSQLYPLLRRINTYLMRWARKKYKRLRGYKRFRAWWTGLVQRAPGLFKHWTWDREFVWAR